MDPVCLWYSRICPRIISRPSGSSPAAGSSTPEARFHGKHTCNGHTALLPAGKLKGAALQKAAVNAAERGRTLHAPVDLLRRKAPYSRGRKRCPYIPFLQKLILGYWNTRPAIKRKTADVFGSAHILTGNVHLACRRWLLIPLKCVMSVDLPQPVETMTPTNSPSSISKLT